MKWVRLHIDPATFGNLPWDVLPSKDGKTAIIFDACNEPVASIDAKSREQMLYIAHLLEEFTRAMLEPGSPPPLPISRLMP